MPFQEAEGKESKYTPIVCHFSSPCVPFQLSLLPHGFLWALDSTEALVVLRISSLL